MNLRRLTRDEILAIPEMKRQGMSNQKIADQYGTVHTTIIYWIKRLRAEGFDVVNLPKNGREPIKLRD